MENAKMCLECGGFDWMIHQHSHYTRHGTQSYSIRMNGSVRDSFDMDDDDNNEDWEDDGDPICSECESENLMELDNLDAKQILHLLSIDNINERKKVAEDMVTEKYYLPEEEKNDKLIGGRRIRQ